MNRYPTNMAKFYIVESVRDGQRYVVPGKTFRGTADEWIIVAFCDSKIEAHLMLIFLVPSNFYPTVI